MQTSYLDVSFFWISQEMDHDNGIGKELWSFKRAMYACKVFPKIKTSENIEFELDQILTEVYCDPANTPVTTDKGANIVAATVQKIRLDFTCHRSNTEIQTGWERAMMEIDELDQLYYNVNKAVTFAKKSSGIQSELPISLKKVVRLGHGEVFTLCLTLCCSHTLSFQKF